MTGAGRRLGRQIAVALGKNGFTVVVNYNKSRRGAEQTVKIIVGSGGTAIAIRADVSRRSAVEKMVDKTVSHFGRIDLLVNNAAIFLDASLDTITEDVWDHTMNINLKGVFFCSQIVAPLMLKQRSGKIINIASLGGLQAWSKHIPYSVSKAGVIMLTRCLARALSPDISVNAIAPGTIIMKGEEDSSLEHLPIAKIPLKKFGRPSDITSLVLYLATTATYITGQIIPVDGGRSIP